MVKGSYHVVVNLSYFESDMEYGKNKRKSFWQRAGDGLDIDDNDIWRMEAKFIRRIQEEIVTKIYDIADSSVRSMSRAVRDKEIDTFVIRELIYGVRHERGEDIERVLPIILDYNAKMVKREAAIPGYDAAVARVGLAKRITVSTNIIEYGSIILGFNFGDISSLKSVFESDFESFRVFFEAFIPEAVRHSIPGVPPAVSSISFSSQFSDSFSPQPAQAVAAGASGPTTAHQGGSGSDTAVKAEWLWRLANGSLLVPVLLSLLVVYFGMDAYSKIGSAQSQALKPLLEFYQGALTLQKEAQKAASQGPADTASGKK